MVTGKYIKVGWGMSRVRVVVCWVGESNSEVHPLTTADTPDIVTAVANANRRKKPAQVRTSQPSSGEESTEHEYLW